MNWAGLGAAGDVLSGRCCHSMTVLVDGTAVLFGGDDDGNWLNEMCTLTVSTTTATWASLETLQAHDMITA